MHRNKGSLSPFWGGTYELRPVAWPQLLWDIVWSVAGGLCFLHPPSGPGHSTDRAVLRNTLSPHFLPPLPLPQDLTHFACLMAPSKVLKSAPQSSTTQWKCTLWRKSHWAAQKSLVPNLVRKSSAVRNLSQKWGLGKTLSPPCPSPPILCRALTCGDTPSRALTASLEPAPSRPCPRKARTPRRGSPPLLS